MLGGWESTIGSMSCLAFMNLWIQFPAPHCSLFLTDIVMVTHAIIPTFGGGGLEGQDHCQLSLSLPWGTLSQKPVISVSREAETGRNGTHKFKANVDNVGVESRKHIKAFFEARASWAVDYILSL